MYGWWLQSMMLGASSASTIALRTMLMFPENGRLDAWQRQESIDMVAEKLLAMHESHRVAIEMAWRLWLTPWSAPKSPHRALSQLMKPYSRRTSANTRRLTRKAVGLALKPR